MSGSDKTTIHYWDACAYLAWIKDERAEYGDDAIDALARIVRDNFEKKATIVTSTITLTEVLSSSLTDEQEKKFRNSFRPHNHVMYDVDPPVALKAREFRERLSKDASGKKLATPDAIHLATAAIASARVVITFDDGKKDKKGFSLIGLSKDPRIDGIEIARPQTFRPPDPQTDLFTPEQRIIELSDE